MPNWEFGMRCTEDMNGNLWIGKVGVTKFDVVFPPEMVQRIKEILENTRKSRRGAFWLNVEKKTLRVVVDDSVDTGEYPEVSLD